MVWHVFRSVRLVFRVSLCAYFLTSAICTTDFSDFTCFFRSMCSYFYLGRQLVHRFFRFYMLFQEHVLLFLPGSATCTTDFSDFTCFSRRVCSFFYLNWQLVRPIFPILHAFVTVFCLLGGVGYFPEFPKLSISRHASPG